MYALITGASSGLGKELAYILASNHYNLILVSRRKHLLEELKKQLKPYEVNILVKVFDLGDVQECFKLFDEVKDMDINLFINNAGFGNIGYFSETNLATELEMIDLNIKAVQILTKLYVTNFDNGVVVNISSLAGFLPTPIHATYSATKSYLSFFSRAINYELKKQKKNVRVLTVAPGPIKTNFNQIANASRSKGMEVKRCAKLIYKGIAKRKEFIVPGFTMKLVYFLNHILPTKLLMSISHKIQGKKR